jgi:hypothetical protein
VNIFGKHLEDAPARLHLIMLDVMVYKPQIVYIKKGTELYIACTLSRDCDVSAEVNETDDLDVLVVLDMTDRIHKELLLETSKDEELLGVSSLIQHGWLDEIDQVSKKMKKFWNFREELTIYENLLFKGDRVVIPRAKVLCNKNGSHRTSRNPACITKSTTVKVLLYNMTNDITNHVQQCSICQHG